MRVSIGRKVAISACLALAMTAEAVDTIVVPLPGGTATFLIESAGAARSAAWRVNADMVGKDGVIPAPSPGYELTSRVLVRAGRGAVDAVLAKLRTPMVVSRVDGAPGCVSVEATTIGGAAALATSLRGAGFEDACVDVRRPMPLRSIPTDPDLGQQWHLINAVMPIADVNIEGAWNLGYTGQGVTIGIVEGGFQWSHEDLSANYDSAASQSGGGATSGTARRSAVRPKFKASM